MKHLRTHNEIITTQTHGKYDHLLSLLYFVAPHESGVTKKKRVEKPSHDYKSLH
jgi:hypothetical protein